MNTIEYFHELRNAIAPDENENEFVLQFLLMSVIENKSAYDTIAALDGKRLIYRYHTDRILSKEKALLILQNFCSEKLCDYIVQCKRPEDLKALAQQWNLKVPDNAPESSVAELVVDTFKKLLEDITTRQRKRSPRSSKRQINDSDYYRWTIIGLLDGLVLFNDNYRTFLVAHDSNQTTEYLIKEHLIVDLLEKFIEQNSDLDSQLQTIIHSVLLDHSSIDNKREELASLMSNNHHSKQPDISIKIETLRMILVEKCENLKRSVLQYMDELEDPH